MKPGAPTRRPKRKMRYRQQYAGDRVRPVMRGYKMCCCDCGLIHVLDFFVIRWGRGHKVEFRARQDKRATSAARRSKSIRLRASAKLKRVSNHTRAVKQKVKL
jgi:hypothetical protein